MLKSIVPFCLLIFVLVSGCSGNGNGIANLAATDENLQIIQTEGPGDVNNLFPLSEGNTWGYHVTGYETGQQPTNHTEEIKVSGTKLVDGNTAFILTSINTENSLGIDEEYFLKNNAAVYYLGDNSPLISLAITPYPIIKFPAVQNGSFRQANKSGIDYGSDLDGDGRNESLAIISTVTVAGNEAVTVETGSIQNCTKLVTSITETLTASRDQRQAVVTGSVSEWYAPEIGLVKRHVEYSAMNMSKVIDYSLQYYVVEGRKSDMTPPVVVSVQPGAGSTTGTASSVQAVFSEDIDPASLNASSFVLSDAAGRQIIGSVTYSNKTAMFVPTSPLTSGTYTATLLSSVQDKMANTLAANYSWSFTLDNSAPFVISTFPANNTTNFPTTSTITATFSEALNGYYLDYNSFTVRDSSNHPVYGQISFSNNVATFTPSGDFAWETTYTATLTTWIRDIAGNPLTSSFSWSFSTPRGLFLSPITHATGMSFPQAVAIGDVNGDGRNDVVVANGIYNDPAHDAKVLVFLQNAAGRLDPPVIYSTSGTLGNAPTTVAIGDVNGDGRSDVVVGNSGKNIEVVLQNANGGLDPGVTYATGDSDKIRITDLNNDGRLDVVGIGPGNNSVSIWYQNAYGTLDAPVSYPVAHNGWDDLDVGDVNGDGLNDIIVMSGGKGSFGYGQGICVLTQKPDGTFNAVVGYGGSYIYPRGVAVGDITGDHRKDVVMTYGGNASKIAVFPQNSLGSLTSPISYESYYNPSAIEIADVDGDGRNDVIVLHDGSSTIGVYLQSTDGTFNTENRYRVPISNFNPQALAVGDINGDGLPDIAAVENNGVLNILYHKPAPSTGKAIGKKATSAKRVNNLSFKGVRIRR